MEDGRMEYMELKTESKKRIIKIRQKEYTKKEYHKKMTIKLKCQENKKNKRRRISNKISKIHECYVSFHGRTNRRDPYSTFRTLLD